MNLYEKNKQQFIDRCESLLDLINQKLPNSLYKLTLVNLLEDLKLDGQIITVLGEFKRGKSTLLNALLGQPLLPSDVTPTTATINVIKHGDEENINVMMENGEVLTKEFRPDVLQGFTFEEGRDLQDIHHIDIEMPLIHLGPQMILVDTPGVGDLNEHRLDVTYSYIPRSNLIVFVFDATTPIRKTELDYLKDTVLKLKFGEVVFVANFVDRLDEEEWEETMEYMDAKLTKIMGDEPFKLFPLSSKEALTNPQDPEFVEFISFIKEKMMVGQAAQKKLDFFSERMNQVFNQVEGEIEKLEAIRKSTLAELEDAKNQVEGFKLQASGHLETLAIYIEGRKEEILSITFKSIDHLEAEIQQTVRENIFLFEGPKFKSFIEKNLPISIKNRTKTWVDAYTPQIDKLINKLETEILTGFSTLFQQEMNALRLHHASNQLEGIQLTVNTKSGSSDTTVKSGLITAGVGAIMMIASGGLLLPFITMAGSPLLNNLLAEKKLTQLKEDVTPLVEKEIQRVCGNLKGATRQYIENEVDHLQEKAVNRFKEYVVSYEQNLEFELTRRKQEQKHGLPSIELNDLLLIKQ